MAGVMAKAVPTAELPRSQVVALLIEYWDYMMAEEQGSIITLLQLS